MPNLIQHIIRETLDEIIGKFDLNQFKKLKYIDEQIAYAKKYLPYLGKGSARIVFALSGHKVLKIATSNRGFGQNNAEVDIYSNPLTKKGVAKVFEVSPESNSWIISEIANPFTSEEEFEKYTGFSFYHFRNLMLNDPRVVIKSHKETLNYYINKIKTEISPYINNLEELNNYKEIVSDVLNKKIKVSVESYYDIQYIYNRILEIEVLINSIENNKKIISFVKSIRNLVTKLNLLQNDLLVLEHYGKTSDGRIILLDYGFTAEVANMYY